MQFKRITSSTNAILTGVYRITKVRLVAGTGAASAILFDGLTYGSAGDANDFSTLSANSTFDSDKESFSPQDGIVTSKGLSASLSGTGSILYIYYE